MANDPAYKIKDFPPSRNIVVDVLREAHRKHSAFGFGEIDCTNIREYMKTYKLKTGENFSFTSYVVWCIAKAIDETKDMHAVKKGKKLIIFDDVDISTLIERETPTGTKVPVTMIIRAANKKSFAEIQDQVRGGQKSEFTGASLGKSKEAQLASKFAKMPGFIRSLVWFKVRHDPNLRKQMVGTVNITAVGMFGTKGGWAISPSLWPLGIVVGGITRRPAVGANDKIEIREFLDLTVVIDHDIVDGAPSARFCSRMIELIENGAELIQ